MPAIWDSSLQAPLGEPLSPVVADETPPAILELLHVDATERGKVTWSVSISEGTGEVDVDLKRGALSFALPPVLGALLVGYAVMLSLQGKNSTPEVQADLDAELLD